MDEGEIVNPNSIVDKVCSYKSNLALSPKNKAGRLPQEEFSSAFSLPSSPSGQITSNYFFSDSRKKIIASKSRMEKNVMKRTFSRQVIEKPRPFMERRKIMLPIKTQMMKLQPRDIKFNE